MEKGLNNTSVKNSKTFEDILREQKEYYKIHGKGLLRNDALYKYILETTVYPREHECLREIRLATDRHPLAFMAGSPDEVQLLQMLLKALNAKNAIEIGVFTGYSLLATALALPDDGKVAADLCYHLSFANMLDTRRIAEIIAIDKSREFYDVGFPSIEKAGMAHKIDFRESTAMPVLDHLLSEEKNGLFDFMFIDADKDNYLNYHERAMKLIRIGGIIAYDNTLWNGSVAASPDEPLSDFDKLYMEHVKKLNVTLVADKRIEVSQLSIGDGVTLCRRVS